MEVNNLKSLDDDIELPRYHERKLTWLQITAEKIVDEVFNPTDSEDARLVIEIMHQLQSGEIAKVDDDGTDVYPYCVCMEGEYIYIIIATYSQLLPIKYSISNCAQMA